MILRLVASLIAYRDVNIICKCSKVIDTQNLMNFVGTHICWYSYSKFIDTQKNALSYVDTKNS